MDRGSILRGLLRWNRGLRGMLLPRFLLQLSIIRSIIPTTRVGAGQDRPNISPCLFLRLIRDDHRLHLLLHLTLSTDLPDIETLMIMSTPHPPCTQHNEFIASRPHSPYLTHEWSSSHPPPRSPCPLPAKTPSRSRSLQFRSIFIPFSVRASESYSYSHWALFPSDTSIFDLFYVH